MHVVHDWAVSGVCWPVDRIGEAIGGLQSVVRTAPPNRAIGKKGQSASQNAQICLCSALAGLGQPIGHGWTPNRGKGPNR